MQPASRTSGTAAKLPPLPYERTLTTGVKQPFTLNTGDTAHWMPKRAVVTNEFRDSRKYEIFDRSNVYNTNGTPKNALQLHFPEKVPGSYPPDCARATKRAGCGDLPAGRYYIDRSRSQAEPQ